MKINLNKNGSADPRVSTFMPASAHARSKKSATKRIGIAAIAATLAHALPLGGLGLLLAACSDSTQNSAHTSATTHDKLPVSASFYPIAWLTEQIGGDTVSVSSITPANVEPHDFELAPKDVNQLSQAKLIFYVAGFQASVDDAVATISGPNIVNLADSVSLEQATADDGHHHSSDDDDHEHADHDHADHDHAELGLDPHFWLDPDRMEDAAEAIAEALGKADPAHKDQFQSNLTTVTSKLDELEHSYETGLAQCTRTSVVTSHAAFGYLTRHFGLEQHSISGIDPEAEPSPADLASVKKIVQETGTTTIFTEELVSPKTAEALATETGATTAVLSPVESKPSTGDYISAMQDNLTALRTALECK